MRFQQLGYVVCLSSCNQLQLQAGHGVDAQLSQGIWILHLLQPEVAS